MSNTKPPVLLLHPLLPPFHSLLSQHFHLLLASYDSPLSFSDFLSLHADAITAILCSGPSSVPAETIRQLPNLRLVVATSTGVDQIDLVECRARGVAVTNAGTVFSEDCADYAVGLLLDVLRRVSAADRYVRSGRWPSCGDYPLGSKLGGKHVGIVGLGSIGSEIAKRLEAFGCIISYNSRRAKPSISYKYIPNILDLATENDVLILSCSLTSETHHIIKREVMSALGRNGIIINVGRGRLIDEKELVKCLVEGEIGGAGLDVFENEPMVPEELLHMDNVVLSNHVSGCSRESLSDMLQVAKDNLEAFFENRPLLTPIDLES